MLINYPFQRQSNPKRYLPLKGHLNAKSGELLISVWFHMCTCSLSVRQLDGIRWKWENLISTQEVKRNRASVFSTSDASNCLQLIFCSHIAQEGGAWQPDRVSLRCRLCPPGSISFCHESIAVCLQQHSWASSVAWHKAPPVCALNPFVSGLSFKQ